MNNRCVSLAAALAILAGGTLPAARAGEAATPPAEPALRLHWLGTKRLASETNAAGFMAIWNLPESRKLEAQTLDKLALAIASTLTGPAGTSNTPAAAPLQPLSQHLLRPLLDDLLGAEVYIEAEPAAACGPWEIALAVRLDAQRAALWQTNFTALVESLTGARPVLSADPAHGLEASLARPASAGPRHLALARVGDWTLLGLAAEQNARFDSVADRIRREPAAFPAPRTNLWLEAGVDLGRLASALGRHWDLPGGLPAVSLVAGGDGATVITRGELLFPMPLSLRLDPWVLPQSLLCGQLASFTAIRGFEPWLASLGAWSGLDCGLPPNQVFCWAYPGLPERTYFAAPETAASNQVARLTDLVLSRSDSWFGASSVAGFAPAKKADGLEWKGLPYIFPFLQSVTTNGESFVFAGLFPNGASRVPLPAELTGKFQSQTNLVAYDWEATPLRLDGWLQIGQILRFVLQRDQLHLQSASMAWLKAIAPRLWPSVTEVLETGPTRLSFKRRSSLGLTAPEIHLLADWLEAPAFPRGLHSFLPPQSETNSPPLPTQARPAKTGRRPARGFGVRGRP